MESPVTRMARALTPRELSAIAGEVRTLIRAGDENSAWERLRVLHPADMGSVLASLPRSGRDSLVRVMDPETVTWMLRQMNPVQAGRLAARLGSNVLSGVLGQVNPRNAMSALLRIHPSQARRVSQTLEQPVSDPELLAHSSPDGGSADAPGISLSWC